MSLKKSLKMSTKRRKESRFGMALMSAVQNPPSLWRRISNFEHAQSVLAVSMAVLIVQSFYGKKSANLPLIATEGFSMVLDSAMNPS